MELNTKEIKIENLLDISEELRMGLKFTFHQEENLKHTERATMGWFYFKAC